MIDPRPDPNLTGIDEAEAALRRGLAAAGLAVAVFIGILLALWWLT